MNNKRMCCFFVGAMDTFARGLRNAVLVFQDGILSEELKVCLDCVWFISNKLFCVNKLMVICERCL